MRMAQAKVPESLSQLAAICSIGDGWRGPDLVPRFRRCDRDGLLLVAFWLHRHPLQCVAARVQLLSMAQARGSRLSSAMA